MNNIYEIQSISFGVFSNEEILGMSVCKVDNQKLGLEKNNNTTNKVLAKIKSSDNKNDTSGTVYDPKMGSLENGVNCETCNQDVWKCPGHFGHIELNESIVHPLYYKHVISILKCFCLKCFKILIPQDIIYLNGFNRFAGISRFTKILDKLDKVDVCYHCAEPHPDIKFSTIDNNICMIYKSVRGKLSINLEVEEIKEIFDNISDEDVRLIGFDPNLVHPRNFIMSVFPVLPPCCRPYIITEGNMCDDDLTNQLVEIIKSNNHLKQDLENQLPESKRQKYLQSLKFRISTFYNNSQGKAKHTTNGRPIKGIKERITGKMGQIRSNIMGRRCDQSGRTVIGPDPTLKMGQLAVPEEMASILTIPEVVSNFNIEKMTSLVNNGRANFVITNGGNTKINLSSAINFKGTRLNHGDIIIRGDTSFVINNGKEQLKIGDKIKRNGEFLEKIAYPCKKKYSLKIGDVVERKLQDGDIVLLNRQPTLHKASMMAQEVVVRSCKTLRMNLAICKPFNADFDGDEMNIHVPQSIEAQTELRLISASKHNIISSQASKPNMAVVQDSLLGAYRMTFFNKTIKKEEFYNIAMKLELTTGEILEKIEHIKTILTEKGKEPEYLNGKGLFSLILPNDLIYEKRNNTDPKEPTVKIYRGVLYEGALDKTILGAVHNSLIQIMYKEYGPDASSSFIDGVQFITNNWLLITSFSVGIKDCLIEDKNTEQEITNTIKKCFIEAGVIKTTTDNPVIRELRITATMNKAKDIGLRLAKNAFSDENNFLSTVTSGSKGDFFNIAQITGLLGQQNLRGQRVIPILNNGKRTLPHYPMENLSDDLEYESRGFIGSSFIKGLNPRQFYFHAMSGREGICDTAMGTATSGYMQRRIVKLNEDIKTQYDGTVRDSIGKIYQLYYGEDGLEPTNTVKVGSSQEPFDISRIVNRLNMKHEIENKNK